MLNVTKNPMTLDYAVQLMKANGCVVVCSEERRTIVTDPNGNEFLLTDDPQCYARFGASFFADDVTPYPLTEETDHVLGLCFKPHDASRMVALLDMVSADEDAYSLWVRHPDGSIAAIDQARLFALKQGAKPKNKVEQMLVDDPEWLGIFEKRVFGKFCVMIAAGRPLPKWNPRFLNINSAFEEAKKLVQETEPNADLSMDEVSAAEFVTLVRGAAKHPSPDLAEKIARLFKASIARAGCNG